MAAGNGRVLRVRLIGWDTALVATPPERDLWHLDPGDGSTLDEYAAMTGETPVPELIELYRLGWDMKDMARSGGGAAGQRACDLS